MKIFTGVVVSVKAGSKTAKVVSERIVVHPLYRKRIRKTKNYLVQDEVGVKEGETVRFVGCRPYSKLKKWKIVRPAVVKEPEKKSDKDKVGKRPKVQVKERSKE